SDKNFVDYAKSIAKNSTGAIATNLLLYGVFKACGQQRFYWLWPLAYLTPFPLFLRIRSMAEHAGMQTSNTALTNTRTTRAGWIARSFVAPIHVNYHMEHHLMASVPYFKLPRMHKILRERGHVPTPPSYFEVIHTLSSKQELTN
ncbi:fatty acid desaturase, partial [Acinetobacter baumannii]